MFVLPPWMYIIRCKIRCIKWINYIDIHMQSERKTVRKAKLNIGLCDYRLYRCVQHESSERRQLLFKQHKRFRLSWRIRRDHFEHICLIISTKKRIIPSCTSLLSVLFYWDFCRESVGMHPLVIRAWKIQLFNLNRGLTKGRGTNSRPHPLTLCRCFFFNCVPRIEFLKERI